MFLNKDKFWLKNRDISQGNTWKKNLVPFKPVCLLVFKNIPSLKKSWHISSINNNFTNHFIFTHLFKKTHKQTKLKDFFIKNKNNKKLEVRVQDNLMNPIIELTNSNDMLFSRWPVWSRA